VIPWQYVVFDFSEKECAFYKAAASYAEPDLVFKKNYFLESETKIPFLRFGDKAEEKWLVLFNENVFFVYDKNNLIYECINTDPYISGEILKAKYTASSFLTEGDVTYSPDNLNDFSRLRKPWANGGGKYAINETIMIEFAEAVSVFFISNGFVDYNHPELYLKNSRVKKISVVDAITNKEELFDLKDDANIQMIRVKNPTKKVIIKILEVYEGTVYKDTCLNFILGDKYYTPSLGPNGPE
jgi:hypothetical protein